MARDTAASARRPLVAIGSRNRAKVNGVRKAFRHFFRRAEFKDIDLTSKVKIQPMGLDETVKGARDRAELAIKEGKADFGVGVEAGIIRLAEENAREGFFLNVQIAAVVDSAGQLSFGSSSGFPIPARFVSLIEGRQVCPRPDRREEDPRGGRGRLPSQQGTPLKGGDDRAVRLHGPDTLVEQGDLRAGLRKRPSARF